MRNVAVLFACLGLMVTAQVLWKTALGRVGVVDVMSSSLPSRVLLLARSWRILAGLVMFGLATILWFDLLSRMELSLLYPFMSLSYVIAFFAGWFFLGENPQPLRLVGIVIIILGIALVARSSP